MGSASFWIALVAVVAMGFANQRGGTCTVAAIEEIVQKRRFGRLFALVEASLWVMGGLLMLGVLGVMPAMPEGHSAGLASILGGVVFGVGAFVNGACLFGSVSRLGSGEWAYLATPVGFFLGVWAASPLSRSAPLAGQSPLADIPAWLALPAVTALIAISLAFHWRRVRGSGRPAFTWTPRAATITIAFSFLVALIAVGSWTYSEMLVELARGAVSNMGFKIVLNFALLAGAILGGWTAGKITPVLPGIGAALQRLAGGATMGIGATLIPGGNTGLVLIGMPMLWPSAWLAFAAMCITLYAAIRVSR